jgi:hypothetical protein
MGPNELTSFLENERQQANKTLLELTPKTPNSIRYEILWPEVLLRHVVRLPDVNKIAAQLRSDGKLLFPDWEKGKRVPQKNYRAQRA